MISLDDLDIATPSDAGIEIEITHPTSGEGLGIFFKIAGRHSERYVQHQRKKGNEKAKESRLAVQKGKPLDGMTIEQIEQQAASILAVCTLGWRSGDKPTVKFDGKEQEYSIEAAERMYLSPKWVWLKNQVDQAIHTDSLFLKL